MTPAAENLRVLLEARDIDGFLTALEAYRQQHPFEPVVTALTQRVFPPLLRTAFQEGGDNDPINQLASYHVDMSISSFGIQEENHFPDQVHEMMPGAARIKGGYMYGSGLPGLGIDLREEIARKYPMQVLPGQPHWTEVRGMDGSVVKP